MEELIILYFISLSYGTVGEGRVTRLDLAKWLMKSKPSVTGIMQKMIGKNLVNRHDVSSRRGHGFVVMYSATVEGQKWLDDNYQAAYEAYRAHIAKVIAAIQAQKPEPEYNAPTVKEKRQIAAGQKRLF